MIPNHIILLLYEIADDFIFLYSTGESQETMSGGELGKIQPITYMSVCNILKSYLHAEWFQEKIAKI